MNRTEIKEKLSTIRNGAYTNITFISEVAVNKDNKEHRVQKVVSAVVRLGIVYSHIQVDAIQFRNRTVGAEEKLPWGEWDPECSCLIEHKGNYYLRCTVSRSPKHHRKIKYLVDGKESTVEEAMLYTRPSEWAKKEEYVFNPKISNILSLGKEVL